MVYWWAWELVQLMVGGQPHKNTRHIREVPWQPCELEPAIQVATNQHCHTIKRHFIGETYLTGYYCEQNAMRGGKGWAKWIGIIGKQSSDWSAIILLAQLSKQTANMVTRAAILHVKYDMNFDRFHCFLFLNVYLNEISFKIKLWA